MSAPEAAAAAAEAAAEQAPGSPPLPPPPPEPESLSQLGRLMLALLRELPKLLSDRVELLSLDLQRAGLALGQIVGLIVAVAILGVTAWLLIWAGVLLALVMVGLPRWGALLLAIVINAAGLWWAVAQIRARIPKLLLSTFRRHLALTPWPLEPAVDAAMAEPGMAPMNATPSNEGVSRP